MVFLRFLSRMLHEQRLKLVFVSLLMAVVGVTEGFVITLIVPLLNMVIPGGTAAGGFLGQVNDALVSLLDFFNIQLGIGIILGIIVAIFIIQGVFRILQMHVQMKMLTEYESSLIHKLFQGFMSSAWPFFLKNKMGQMVNVLVTETSRATTAFQYICQFLASLFIAIFYIALALLVSWPITLGGIVLAALASLLLRKLMKTAEEYGLQTSEANNELQSYAFDKLAAAKMLKATATGDMAMAGLSSIVQRKVRLRYLTVLNAAAIRSFYEPLVMAILAIIGYLAITQWGADIIIIIVFVLIFFRLMPHFSAMQAAYQQALIFIPGLTEVDNLGNQIAAMPDSSGKTAFGGLQKAISFRDVGFSYDGKTLSLKDVNLEIEKGTSVAIVGESGVGKTTLVDLLLGLLAPTQGQVLVDGRPLQEYEPYSWRRAIGYMSQDIFLFHDTIENNLRWTARDASMEDIEAAARLASADNFVREAPDGYQAVVGDRGVRLSVGQRQRLALTRTILQNPDIIILDEATSSLDSESEAMIQEAIGKTWTNKTVITIAHRLATVRDADKIYVLEGGTIAESGTWDELVKLGGRFEKMRSIQNL